MLKPPTEHVNLPFFELFSLIPQLNPDDLSANPLLIESITRHLVSITECSTYGLRAIGQLIGAESNDELPTEALSDLGWLIAMLAELANSAEMFKANLAYSSVK